MVLPCLPIYTSSPVPNFPPAQWSKGCSLAGCYDILEQSTTCPVAKSDCGATEHHTKLSSTTTGEVKDLQSTQKHARKLVRTLVRKLVRTLVPDDELLRMIGYCGAMAWIQLNEIRLQWPYHSTGPGGKSNQSAHIRSGMADQTFTLPKEQVPELGRGLCISKIFSRGRQFDPCPGPHAKLRLVGGSYRICNYVLLLGPTGNILPSSPPARRKSLCKSYIRGILECLPVGNSKKVE